MKKKIEENLPTRGSIGFLLSKQKDFCARFMPVDQFRPEPTSLTENPKEDPRVIWCLDAIVCFIQETAELRNIMPWKHWKDYSDWEPPIPHIHEEIVDQLHFITNIAVTLGLNDIGELSSYFTREEEHLINSGVDLKTLSNISGTKSAKPSDDLRVRLTLSTITELEMALNSFRSLFPWSANKDYPSWSPDYSCYKKEYKRIFGFFVRECVIWGLNEKSLIIEYLEKHGINIRRQEDGYIWNPDQKKL